MDSKSSFASACMHDLLKGDEEIQSDKKRTTYKEKWV